MQADSKRIATGVKEEPYLRNFVTILFMWSKTTECNFSTPKESLTQN